MEDIRFLDAPEDSFVLILNSGGPMVETGRYSGREPENICAVLNISSLDKGADLSSPMSF